ncbi:MAG TPA: hypothetical protein VLM89_08190, partial [Phycisphaerae bacterium]|nr:hypothetical protein [Phycisphaerae bacterium]
AADDHTLYFYARTAKPITRRAARDWMLLFIDLDRDPATGWQGYDFVVNRLYENNETSVLETAGAGWNWKAVGQVTYRVKADEMELAIPMNALGIKTSAGDVSFDFKWADHFRSDDDVSAFMLNGDTAPNNRFNYRY